jgi:phosphoglycolate phosphatase
VPHTIRKMRYETLIFDLDGTISDPFVGISRSINFALESLDYKPVDPETIRPMIGPPLSEIFTHFLGDLREREMHGLIDKYRERYASVGYRENTLYDDMPEIISELDSRGYSLGVCTAKRADYAVKILQHFSLDTHIDFVDGGGIDVHKKTQIARIISSGIDHATAIMIGDRAGDINAAKNNAVHSVGVLWGFGVGDEIVLAAPDFIASTPSELQTIFR